MDFDPSKAILRGPGLFPPFRPRGAGEPLAAAGLPEDEMLIVVERAEGRRAFVVTELAYHHVAQGRIGGEPYLVCF
jgi:hypothetical protein